LYLYDEIWGTICLSVPYSKFWGTCPPYPPSPVIHAQDGMTMRFYRRGRGTDNFDEATTALVNEQSGYDPSEYDNSVTLGSDAHPAKEQQ